MDSQKGLYKLKDSFTSQRRMAADCMQLCDCLAEAIKSTLRVAPTRNAPYLLQRQNERIIKRPASHWHESHWEEAAWRFWKEDVKRIPIPGAWEYLVSFQVMMRDTNEDKGWGEIDLLGFSTQGWPVAVELKQARCKETPLRFLVEAASYGVALQKAWHEGTLKHEWTRRYPSVVNPDFWPIVCAAPSDYWEWCRERPYITDAWPAFRTLIQTLGEHRLPATFVEITYTGNAPKDQYPMVTGARIVHPWSGEENRDNL